MGPFSRAVPGAGVEGGQPPGELPTIGFLAGEHAGVHLPIRAVAGCLAVRT